MKYLPFVIVVTAAAIAFYWYQEEHSACRLPVEYRIGTIDSEFGISYDEVRDAVSDAEKLWEDATGENLFVFSEGADLTVNFLFDSRQEFSNEEHRLREVLETKENLSDVIQEQYNTLITRYENLKSRYDSKLATYEQDLEAHNSEVEHWNSEGGAPSEVFEKLNENQHELNHESRELAVLARQVNGLVQEINTLGAKGNEVVEDYNEDVETYNERFNHAHEFTQGDYQGDSINIYQFDDGTELRIVLAHELGHALSLDHVDDEQSIMYYLMEGQLEELALSAFDLAEYKRVCTP